MATVRAARKAGRCKVIVINNTWEKAPWADALYACDPQWWRHYKPTFAGQKWSQCEEVEAFGGRRVMGREGPTLSLDPSVIAFGRNSGFQAINLALHFGAGRIVLAGFDCQSTGGKAHWHADHSVDNTGMHNPTETAYQPWRKAFANAARQLRELGIPCLNASRETALTCFERTTLEKALACS